MWEVNQDYTLHPIMKCNVCDAVFQGPHECEYEKLKAKNKELRMEIYELKMKEATRKLVDSIVLSADGKEFNLNLMKNNVEIMRLRKALEFYADNETYTDDRQRTSTGELVHTGYTGIQCDTGKIARKALEGTTEDGGHERKSI